MTALDILVVGGGPAGVVTAIGLQRLGHRVGLVTAPRRFAAVEGISARACEGLRYCDCRHALATIEAPVPRTALWNGERTQHNQECIVDRRRFDAALVEDARETGLTVIHGRVMSTRARASEWLLRCRADGAIHQRAVGYLIDARGRATGRSGKRWLLGPSTMSLGQSWRFQKAVEPGTGIAPTAEGWVWYAIPKQGDAVIHAFLSTEKNPLPSRARLAQYYRDQVDRATDIAPLIRQGQPRGAVSARDAGTAICADVIGFNSARVGDAALQIDPLSGNGLYRAVSGGLALAPVVNTQLRRPENATLAESFYREKLSFDFGHMARAGRDFYRMEQRWPERQFWRERQAWSEDETGIPTPPDALPRIERRAVSERGFIEAREVVVTHDHPRGVWRVAGVCLVELLHLIQKKSGSSLASIVDLASENLECDAAAAKLAAGWLVSRGLARSNDRGLVAVDALDISRKPR